MNSALAQRIQARTDSAFSKNNPHFTVPLLLFTLSILLYVNTLGHGFVFDDQAVLTDNTYVTQGFSGLDEIFTTGSWSGFNPERNLRIFRPLQLSVLAVQYELFGLNPQGYHIVHVLSYATLCALVFTFLRRLLFREDKGVHIAFIASFLFTLHPVHTEVVANIKGNGDLLAMLFGVISLMCIERFIATNLYRHLFASSFALLIALFFKETAVTVIGIAILMLYYFSGMRVYKLALSILPLCLPVIIYLTARHLVFEGNANTLDDTTTNISNVLLMADGISQELGMRMYSLGKNLWLLVFPYPLLMMYVYDSIPIVEVYEMESLFPFAVYSLLLLVFLTGIKRRSLVSFTVGFYLVTIFLFSNILFSIPNLVSERWLLLPSLPFCLALAIFIIKVKGDPIYSKAGFVVLAFLCLGYAGYTVQRNRDWESNFTLSTHDVKTAPRNYNALRMASSEWLIKGKKNDLDKKMLAKSANYMEEVLSMTPADYVKRNSLGIIYELQGEHDLAAHHFGKVARIESDIQGKARYSYAKNLVGASNYYKALASLNELEKDYPKHAGVKGLKGKALQGIGKKDAASEAFNLSLSLDPTEPNGCEGMATHYLDLANANKLNPQYLKQSAHYHEQWLSQLTAPSTARSLGYNRLGQIYEQLKLKEKAARSFGLAAETPSRIQAKAAFSQARNLSEIGRYAEALPLWKSLHKKYPQNIDVLLRLAEASEELNQEKQAKEHYHMAFNLIQKLEDPSAYSSFLEKMQPYLIP